jgi:hypothetical protein
MGGIGSGRQWTDIKTLTTDCRKLDVLELHHAGALKPGLFGHINWPNQENGHICFSSEEDNFHFSYHGGYFSNQAKQDRTIIPLVWTDCRYGNQRPYFRCPDPVCNRKVEHLYSQGEAFLCRYCLNLAYPCQNENWGDRAARRANKARIKLGGTQGILTTFPMKPKGMHDQTYIRLRRYSRAEGDKAFKYVYKNLGGDVDDVPTIEW